MMISPSRAVIHNYSLVLCTLNFVGALLGYRITVGTTRCLY